MKTFTLLGIIALSLAACATPGPTWAKSGGSNAETKADLTQCKRQADNDMQAQGSFRYYESDLDASNDPLALAEQQELLEKQNVLVDACMNAKGYVKLR